MIWLIALSATSQTIDLKIENIRNHEGFLWVAIFDNESNFKKEKAFWEKRYSKKEMQEDNFRTIIRIPPGTYGISVLDDENNDKKMNYTLIGTPREGFGFSNHVQHGLRAPRFNNFSFKIKENEETSITVSLKYM